MSSILCLTRLLTPPDMTLSKDFWASLVCIAQGGAKHLAKHTRREAPSGSLCPFVFCVSSIEWSRKSLYLLGEVGRGHTHAAEQRQREIIVLKRSDDVRTVTETNPVRIRQALHRVQSRTFCSCSLTQSRTRSQLRAIGDGEGEKGSRGCAGLAANPIPSPACSVQHGPCSASLAAPGHAEEGQRHQQRAQSTESNTRSLENQKLKSRHKD